MLVNLSLVVHGYIANIDQITYEAEMIKNFRLYHFTMIFSGRYIDGMSLIPVQDSSRKTFDRKRMASQSIRKRSVNSTSRQKTRKADWNTKYNSNVFDSFVWLQSFSLHFFWSFYPQQHFIVLKHNLWSAILAQMPWQAKNDFIFEFYGSFYPNEHIISWFQVVLKFNPWSAMCAKMVTHGLNHKNDVIFEILG